MFVEKIEPRRMGSDNLGDDRNTENIEKINNHQSKRDIPQFFSPRPPVESNDTNKNISLLDSGTAPNDPHRVAISMSLFSYRFLKTQKPTFSIEKNIFILHHSHIGGRLW